MKAGEQLVRNHSTAVRSALGLWVVVIGTFVAVALQALREFVQPVDDWFWVLAVEAQWQPAVVTAKLLSVIGSGWVMVPFEIAVGVVLFTRRRLTALACWVAAIVTSEVVVWISKALYDRARPPDALVSTTGASFPSAHTATAAVVAITLVLVFLPVSKRRWYWFVAAAGWSAVMAVSRVYVRAHWFSDAIAGAAVGAAFAITVALLIQWWCGAQDNDGIGPGEASSGGSIDNPVNRIDTTMHAVEVNVPEASETVRSPTDALNLVTSLLVALGTAVVVIIFPDVFGGLGVDLDAIFEEGSAAAAEITGLVLTAIALAVPLVLVVYFVWVREFRRLAIVFLAAIVGAIATALAIELLSLILSNSIVAPGRQTVVVAETAYYPYVAATTAAITAAAPWMPRIWRRVAWISLATLLAVRLLLGSNLPAELVLALALGAAAGSAVLFLLGSPNRQPTGSQIVATLRRSGIDPARIDVASVDARGSTPYFVITTDGDRLFVKTLSTDERSADILFRLYRRFRFKNIGDEPAFSSLRRAVEHEALLAHSAAAAGVRTPEIVAVGRIGDEDYSMLLAQRAIEGRSLDSVPRGELADGMLTETWQQIAILRTVGIAHRDLRLANVFLDARDDPWIIDFGFSELAASDLLLDNDIAEFVTSSALLVGPERSVGCAVQVLGPRSVAGAARRLQHPALSGATKSAVKERDDDLLEQIRAEIATSTGRATPPLDRITRLGRPRRRGHGESPTGDSS